MFSFYVLLRTKPGLSIILVLFLFFPQIRVRPNAAIVVEGETTGTGRRTRISF
jgi:hypothetical protein